MLCVFFLKRSVPSLNNCVLGQKEQRFHSVNEAVRDKQVKGGASLLKNHSNLAGPEPYYPGTGFHGQTHINP